MPLIARIERALTTHLEHLDSPNAPPKLIKAIQDDDIKRSKEIVLNELKKE